MTFEQTIVELLGLEAYEIISLQINIEAGKRPELIMQCYIDDKNVVITKDDGIN